MPKNGFTIDKMRIDMHFRTNHLFRKFYAIRTCSTVFAAIPLYPGQSALEIG